MKGALFIYAVFILICLAGVVRPHLGLIGYYGFVVLQPEWNWRWSMSSDIPYQKWIAISVFVGFLVTSLRGNRIRGPSLLSVVCLFSFLLLSFISSSFSIAPEYSHRYMEVIWKIVIMIPIGMVVLDTPQKIQSLMWAITICSGYNVFQINLEYFQTGYCRAAQTGWAFIDNNGYSLVTLSLIPYSASLACFSGMDWRKCSLAGFILLLQTHVIMLLLSRAAMLGALSVLVIWTLLVRKSLRMVVLITAFLCGSYVLLGDYVINEFMSSFSEENLDASVASRPQLWRAGWEITKNSPLLGVGPDAARIITPEYMDTDQPTRALHNLFLEISTGMGLPATALFIGFFGFVYLGLLWVYVRERSRLPNWQKAVCLLVLSGVPGYWLASMFNSASLLEAPYVTVIIGGATLLVRKKDPVPNSNPQDTISAFDPTGFRVPHVQTQPSFEVGD